MKIRVYYEDTDVGGVVYHSNYLNFCERGRSDIFFQKGLSPHSNEAFFVVKKIECDYIAPAKLGDLLDVETEVIETKRASIILKQSIKRDDELLFRAKVLLVFLKKGRISKIPKEILNLFS